MNVLIITGGRIESRFAVNYINEQEWDRILSADAGLVFCRKAGVIPDRILGDFDSADPATLAWYQERYPERIVRFPAEKDETDTELALMDAIDAGASRVTILGGTGSRLDHVLGNIHLLKMAMDAGVECFLVDEHNRIRMTDKGLTLHKSRQFGHYVSLIPFTPAVAGLTLNGFAYDVEEFTLLSGKARGVSNQIAEETAHIALREGVLLVIESRD